jgi:hypothetical protein
VRNTGCRFTSLVSALSTVEFNFNGPSGTLQVVLAVLLGLGTMGYGAYSYTAQSSALDSAVTVDATVVSTSVETVAKRRGTGYAPQATFDYTYDGESYTSSKVYPEKLPREFDTAEDARAQLEEYEPGGTVTAYVSPDSPGEAFLEHESSTKPLIVIGFGAVVLLGTVASVLRN